MELPKINVVRENNDDGLDGGLLDMLPGLPNRIIDDNQSNKSHNDNQSERSNNYVNDYENDNPSYGNENDNVSVQMSDGGYTEEMNPNEMMKKKKFYLRKLDRYRKKGMTVSRHFTLDDDYNDLKIEYETIKKEIYLETALKENKQWLCLAVTGMEWLNKKVDPIGAKLDGWNENVAIEVENGEYDEVLEELYDKYYGTFDLPPELQLLKKLGQSAFMFHTSKTVLSSFGISNENVPLQARQEIFQTLNKHGMLEKQKKEFDRMNSQMPGLPKFTNNMRRQQSKTNLSDHSISAPSVSDDIMKELDMNTSLPQTAPMDSKSQLSVSADGKRTLILS
jgi:hypothetical protein